MEVDIAKATEKSSQRETAVDNVNHPSHYAGQGKVECIDFISTVVNKYPGIIAGDLQNVTKYTWRSHGKNGKEDIEKASWYFNHAEKTWNGLTPEAKGLVKEFSQHPILTVKNAETIQKEGIAEVTKEMKAEEKKLYLSVIDGLNHFTNDASRQKAKEALLEWSRSYQNFQEQEKNTKLKRKAIGIQRVSGQQKLER